MVRRHGFLDHPVLDDLERLDRSQHHEIDLSYGVIGREGLGRAILVDHEPVVRLQTPQNPVAPSRVEVTGEHHRVLPLIEERGQCVRLGETFFGGPIEVDTDDRSAAALGSPPRRPPKIDQLAPVRGKMCF